MFQSNLFQLLIKQINDVKIVIYTPNIIKFTIKKAYIPQVKIFQ